MPDRSSDTLLTLPQNFNDGWTATWQGKELPAQRVDGWKQGWRLPAGSAGQVTLSFAPAGTFTVLLVAGAVLAGLCVLAVVWSWRRERRGHEPDRAPALRTGRPGPAGRLGGGGRRGPAVRLVGAGRGPGRDRARRLLRRFQGWPVLAAAVGPGGKPGPGLGADHRPDLGGDLEPGLEPGRRLCCAVAAAAPPAAPAAPAPGCSGAPA